jgi:Ca2+-binding RTX toxin-like protein
MRSKHLMYTLAAVLVELALFAPALGAGTVQIEGDKIVFRGGNNQVNEIEVDPAAPTNDEIALGVAVTDKANNLILVGPGCTASGNRAVCERRSVISLELGDKNDRVSQKLTSQAIPMLVNGGTGDDVISGSVLADTLDGGWGNDTIDGGEGNDVLKGDLGDDRMTGGLGVDKFFGSSGVDTINSQDNKAEVVDCGIGIDSATTDSNDTRKQCN